MNKELLKYLVTAIKNNEILYKRDKIKSDSTKCNKTQGGKKQCKEA